MTKLNIPKKRQDDYYGVAAIALCEASIEYTNSNLKEKVSFDRFARIIIKNQIIDEFRKENALKRKCITVDIDDEEISGDLIFTNSTLYSIDIVELIRRLSEREVKLLSLLNEGYTCKEIAKMFGLSASGIYALRNRLGEKAKEVMGEVS